MKKYPLGKKQTVPIIINFSQQDIPLFFTGAIACFRGRQLTLPVIAADKYLEDFSENCSQSRNGCTPSVVCREGHMGFTKIALTGYRNYESQTFD